MIILVQEFLFLKNFKFFQLSKEFFMLCGVLVKNDHFDF